MKIIDKIYHAKQAPRNKNVLWIDGEKKMYVYGNKWENLGNSGNSGGFTPEEVNKAALGYPYNAQYQITEEPASLMFRDVTFEGDLMITYLLSQATDMRLFAEGSFLANHVQKVNIMGIDVEDMASLPDILTMINDTYNVGVENIVTKFTLDTDTIEGDLFGIDYNNESFVPTPTQICVNCKVKSLDCSHMNLGFFVSMLNSPTEILEQGSIKGNFIAIILPLALKNLEENAFAKYSTTEGGDETDCKVTYLFMLSLTVPESLPQSLALDEMLLYFPALIGERTYKDYVKDVFNIDVTQEEQGGVRKIYSFDVSTGNEVTFKQQQQQQ